MTAPRRSLMLVCVVAMAMVLLPALQRDAFVVPLRAGIMHPLHRGGPNRVRECSIRERHPHAACVVYGVGFQKTGTTTLGVALDVLGYKVCRIDGPGTVAAFDNNDHYRRDVISMWVHNGTCDAYEDFPWYLPETIHEFRDVWNPKFADLPNTWNAKYVLTHRPSEDWFESALNHFGSTVNPRRRVVYGTKHQSPKGNKDHYIATYEEHNRRVRQIFDDDKENLLELDISKDELTWANLCPFIGIRPEDCPVDDLRSFNNHTTHEPAKHRMVHDGSYSANGEAGDNGGMLRTDHHHAVPLERPYPLNTHKGKTRAHKGGKNVHHSHHRGERKENE
eukprot:TRINITY_DN6978_c0_g1_i1.p1 TRINITY_DN6978_c0_g1~~TRINITY_DN6978_c0_g1_i1.p1  ORF type:complete len:335 (-),score=38.64 TRINITY_DN6978_c0_g1_i1:122-1126(-)